MTPQAARLVAEDVLSAHRAVNASYSADPSLARQANLASIILGLADQIDGLANELAEARKRCGD